VSRSNMKPAKCVESATIRRKRLIDVYVLCDPFMTIHGSSDRNSVFGSSELLVTGPLF